MSEDAPDCFDCAKPAPQTNTNYTLISQTGWRLIRERQPNGTMINTWRCPQCWAKRRALGLKGAAGA